MDKFIKFGLVGVLNTLIQILIFNILQIINFDLVLANSIGYLFGMINSYLWNNIWVFKAKSKEIITVVKFIVINLITLFINNILLLLLVDNLNFNTSISQIVSIIFTMSINFLGNKLWTFKKENI